MCDFHSIVVRVDGAIAHTAQNSHSGAVVAAGWQENTNTKTVFVECEWDGEGPYSLEKVVSRRRNGLKVEDLTNKQVRAINRHYKALRSVVTDGDIKAIKPGGVLHGLDYWDVYLAAINSDKVSEEDKGWIRKELLTATAGDSGTATAGDKGTATAGNYGTATAGNYGTATAGYYGTATAGYSGTATAGYSGTATAGDSGTATAGYSGTATAGDKGTATAGNYGTATAGYSGTATAGYKGTATAGYEGVIVIEYYDSAAEKWRRKIGYVDGTQLKPGIPYKLDDQHEFTEAKSK